MSKAIVLAAAVVFGLTANVWSQAEEPNKAEIIRQAAQEWIEVGVEEFERELFAASEKSFLEAKKQQMYLSTAQSEQIKKYLEKITEAAAQREEINENIKAADEFLENGEFLKAKALLEKIRANPFLNSGERQQTAEKLITLDKKLGEQKKEIMGLYKKSVELYEAGQLEQAREGFVRAVQSGLFTGSRGNGPVDYLLKIDSLLLAKKAKVLPEVSQIQEADTKKEPDLKAFQIDIKEIESEPKQSGEQARVVENPMMIEVAEPENEETETPKIKQPEDEASRKNNLQRSYAVAKIKDGVAKTRTYVNEGKFYKAKETADLAEQLLNENRERLGEEVFAQFSKEIEQLNEEILRGRARWLGSWENRTAWKL